MSSNLTDAVTYPVSNGDTAWLLTSTALVLIMTPGLGFFYGGLCHSKSIINTLMMSFSALAVVTLQFVLVGFSFSFGPGSVGFGDFTWAGLKGVGMLPNTDYAPTLPFILFCMYQMMFAIVTPALISGSITGRMKFSSWLIFMLLWSICVYDLVAHWVWAAYTVPATDTTESYLSVGWLRGLGAIDFAGGTVVHMTSGFSALATSVILGPRKHHIDQAPRPANVPFVILGTALLWFGWFGFNAGSALMASGDGIGPSASIALANTQIAGASASLTWMLLDWAVNRKASAVGACEGAVVGLVVITPASGFVVPGFAIVIGAVGCAFVYGCVQVKARWLQAKMHFFDDTLDVFACHGLGGAVGAFLTGLFATTEVNPVGVNGAFYGNPALLGWQVIAIVVTACVSIILTSIILLALRFTIGIRSSDEAEALGLDKSTHGELHLDDIEQLREMIDSIESRLAASTQGAAGKSVDGKAYSLVVSESTENLTVLVDESQRRQTSGSKSSKGESAESRTRRQRRSNRNKAGAGEAGGASRKDSGSDEQGDVVLTPL